MAAQLQMVRTPAEEQILARIDAVGSRLPQGRAEAAARLRAAGLPNRRVEAWHYTDLRALMRDAPPPFDAFDDALIETAAAASPLLDVADAAHVLFVNGRFVRREGDVEIVEMEADDVASPEPPQALDGAVALHRVFATRATRLQFAAPSTHVHLDFREAGDVAFSTFPHIEIDVADGCAATIVETHTGPDGLAYQTHARVAFRLGQGAKVAHVRVNAAGDKAIAISTLDVQLAGKAIFNSFSLATGGAASRHQIFLRAGGEQCSIDLGGVTLARARQHLDTTLVVEHIAPRCKSREFYRNIIDDAATGVFQGKIMVAKDAQKTDGAMKSQTILLSDDAAMNNKPELEIFADDVVCGHGATCGALDENHLFYAHARGIPPVEAQAMLLEAFAGEAVDRVADEALREQLMERVRGWLAQRVGA